MSIKFDEKVIAQLKLDFEKAIDIAGDVIKFRKFESSNVKDPLYDNERKEVSLTYREVDLVATISLDPKQWKMDDQGKRLEVDAAFTIASKSFEDVNLEPQEGLDRVLYKGIEYNILQIKKGSLPSGEIMTYELRCLAGPGV